jgi:hypothetical protein
VLLNTQVMEWKLPSYSRLKRNLHEVQRNAQRGGELTKRLLNRLEAMSIRDSARSNCGTVVADSVRTKSAVAGREPRPAIRREEVEIKSAAGAAPVFSEISKKVPHTPM